MLPIVRTTAQTRIETISPRGKDPYNMTVELLDLQLPGKRHPVEITRRVDDTNPQLLELGVDYVLGGDIFELGKYSRLEFNSYNLDFIKLDEVLEHYTGTPSDSADSDVTDFDKYGT